MSALTTMFSMFSRSCLTQAGLALNIHSPSLRHEYIQQGFRNQIPYLFGYMFTFSLPLPWQSRLFSSSILSFHPSYTLLAKRGRWQSLFPHLYPLRLFIGFPFLQNPVCCFAQVPRYCPNRFKVPLLAPYPIIKPHNEKPLPTFAISMPCYNATCLYE